MRKKKMATPQTKITTEKHDIYLILHNIRSAHNVGAIFRTADAAGVTKIFLTGYTPVPSDRFGRVQKEIAKTALGAERSIPWERVSRIVPLMTRLKKEGVTIVGLEQSPRAVDYRSYAPSYPLALIVGNEVRGIAPALLKHTDAVVEIPMHGAKESLNVSVATGVALFGWVLRG